VYAGLGTAVEFQSVQCADRIALITRGGGSFAEKATAAMDAHRAAAIIHNHTPGNFTGTLGTPTTADGRRPGMDPGRLDLAGDGLYLKDQVEARESTATLVNVASNLAALSGTSMASPHAAGVAALVLGKNPSLSVDEARAILRASAEDLATPGWDPAFGYGRVNARRAVEITP
jgi:subtilisin family serine protease